MKKAILIAVICTAVFANNDEVVFDYYGLQGVSGNHKLQEMEFSYTGGMFTSLFRWQDAYLGYFGFGVADILLPSLDEDISDLSSSTSIIADLEFVRPSQWLYLTGSVKYYNIKGNVTHDEAAYVQENNYSLLEFPLGLGIHYTYRFVHGMAGIRKSWYYGLNNFKKFYLDNGTEIQLNEEDRTFTDEGEITFHLNLAFTIMDNYYIGLSTSLGGSGDYYVGLTLASRIGFRK